LSGNTVQINLSDANKDAAKKQKVLASINLVYQALKEKGYDPINQLVEYILSDDPTYITSYNGARKEINSIDRFDLLHVIFSDYFDKK